MEKLIDYLLHFGSLNDQQIAFIKKHATELLLNEGDYFSEAGKVANRVGFILDGIIRVSYYNKNGEDVTRYFIDEDNFVVDLNSFDNRIPSSEYVQAVTECKLLVFSKKSWEDLSHTILGWDAIVAKITSKGLLQKIERISPLIAEDATTRYLTFLDRYPGIANRVALVFIASYLGITPSSLSRIRRSI
ncbi:Crp/Fnr family transcriptional regulator [Pedobacter jamesrossensis]|uniref:Crp/Fnr family transcriptional regulator n=1 Tax=Pedobacter jamesrossensis TaxID=1908238 RepID=A0ABV8NTA8_9SPHI